jgi:hypothetical protein
MLGHVSMPPFRRTLRFAPRKNEPNGIDSRLTNRSSYLRANAQPFLEAGNQKKKKKEPTRGEEKKTSIGHKKGGGEPGQCNNGKTGQ